LQHLNALTANLRAAGLLGLSVGLAVAVALAGVVASVVWVVGAITRRELRQEARRLSLAPMTQVAGRKFDWTGPGVAAVLLALLPLAGCGPSLVGPRNATAAALFRHPDFFKVGVAQAGNHDNRVYEDDWAEKWQGLLVAKPDGSSNYDDQANQNHAKNLKGKLLLAHGTMDNNVPFYSTLLVVNELIKANKDFDLILFPNRAHMVS
jgi:hypothetical protein